MLKDIFGSLGFVIVGSDILFWAYFFIMCNSIILKLEDVSSIKRYFEFILSQTEKGEKFPIKLDDVFALVYSRKDKAVRALIDSDQFM